jgi:hypothetical protein
MKRKSPIFYLFFQSGSFNIIHAIHGMYGDEDRLEEVPYYDRYPDSNTLFSEGCFRGRSLLYSRNIDFCSDLHSR